MVPVKTKERGRRPDRSLGIVVYRPHCVERDGGVPNSNALLYKQSQGWGFVVSFYLPGMVSVVDVDVLLLIFSPRLFAVTSLCNHSLFLYVCCISEDTTSDSVA